jgi:hypothetical protein
MYCPNCGAEYRPGFTECSDCEVALVDSLPRNPGMTAGNAIRDGGAGGDLPVQLWSGVDPRAFGDLRAALDAAQIAYSDETHTPQLLGTLQRDPFEIWIHQVDRKAAAKVVEDVFGYGSENRELGEIAKEPGVSWLHPFGLQTSSSLGNAQFEGGAADNAPSAEELPEEEPEGEPADDIVEEFYPEDATAAAWSGDSAEMAQFLRDSLSGNGIGSVVSEAAGQKWVMVLPEAEKRAREIVRQVVEGTPE